MTTRARPTPTVAPPTRHGTRPSGLAVVGSLAVGLTTAMALALGVFAGADEAVTTGALLVGFGAGWGALAVASGHVDRPQPWARVPAAAMVGTGAALLLLRPGDTGMTALSWAWPPLTLVLAAWTWGRARRGLPRLPRLLLAPVLLVLVAASGGAVVQAVSDRQVRRDHPAPGTTYSVGDHRLHLDCRGAGEPTVVLFNGLGEFSGSWARVVDQVGGTTRVCAYDRPEQGWSGDVDRPQDGITTAADLHALLAAADVPGPYVLAGHSTGGPYALTYAAEYPQDVAGVVLLDSSSPHQMTAMPDYPVQYALMKRGFALWATLTRTGLGAAVPYGSHLPGRDGEVADAISSTVRAKRNARDEVSMVPTVLHQAQALTSLGDLPLAVITASENLSTAGWPEEQRRLAGLSSNSTHVVAAASHAGLLEDGEGAAASATAITAVVSAVRSSTPLTSHRP